MLKLNSELHKEPVKLFAWGGGGGKYLWEGELVQLWEVKLDSDGCEHRDAVFCTFAAPSCLALCQPVTAGLRQLLKKALKGNHWKSGLAQR